MTDWGKPDFDARTTEQQAIDHDAPGLREDIRELGGMDCWPSELKVEAGYSPADVQEHCVRDSAWQRIRLSMKGKPTHKKLAILKYWWYNAPRLGGYSPRVVEIQVGNYLGALRRGGQLDAQNRVRKYI